MAQDGNELVRLDQLEQKLIRNYRRINESRQDTLLYFSDELVKLQLADAHAEAGNVVHLRASRK